MEQGRVLDAGSGMGCSMLHPGAPSGAGLGSEPFHNLQLI